MSFGLKKPLTLSVHRAAVQRANNFVQTQSKGIPCHVVAIDKDFVTVHFEPQNGIWNLPQMKLSQAFSPFARDPTQVGDKGYAVPGDYALNSVNGDATGQVPFTIRGNLTPLVFHPISKKQNETRDYDQYTVAGGPNGVKILQKLSQQNQQPPTDGSGNGSGGSQTPSPIRRVLTSHYVPGRGFWASSGRGRASSRDDSSSSSSQRASMEIDKNGVITHQTGDQKHQIVIDQTGQKLALNVPATGSDMVYLGGPGKNPSLYAPIGTAQGPAVNVMAKYIAQDEQ